jgi:TatD DNase family protein
MLIDTHCHLDYPDFDRDRAHVIARAVEAGVTEMISIGTRIETSASAIKVARSFPNVWATVGIHPLEVTDAPDNAMEQLRELALNERVVAIGEIGLDYHEIDQAESRVIKGQQADLFQSQLELARLSQLAGFMTREGAPNGHRC